MLRFRGCSVVLFLKWQHSGNWYHGEKYSSHLLDTFWVGVRKVESTDMSYGCVFTATC